MDPTKFYWKKSANFHPTLHPFQNVDVGCTDQEIGDDPSILECFELFFSAEIMTKIAEQTNLYYHQNVDNFHQNRHRKKWVDTDADEMSCFMALSFLMAQIKKLKLRGYWSKDTVL